MSTAFPQKRYYRQRAHVNPYSDHDLIVPASPQNAPWKELYPQWFEEPQHANSTVRFADIGCGYGGLLVLLAKTFPDTLSLGMELRVKVSDFVNDRLNSLRAENPGQYQNVAVIRSNSMKFLPNFFQKGQLQKMFFLFPDPHFKKVKHKWRIISPTLLAEYAFVLEVGGLIYTLTDVDHLNEWMVKHLLDHPLFEQLSPDEVTRDELSTSILNCSEEGKKVERNHGQKFLAIFRRIADPFENKPI